MMILHSVREHFMMLLPSHLVLHTPLLRCDEDDQRGQSAGVLPPARRRPADRGLAEEAAL